MRITVTTTTATAYAIVTMTNGTGSTMSTGGDVCPNCGYMLSNCGGVHSTYTVYSSWPSNAELNFAQEWAMYYAGWSHRNRADAPASTRLALWVVPLPRRLRPLVRAPPGLRVRGMVWYGKLC